MLEELCQKNNWGQPVYQLHSAIGPDQRQLFLYKITVPALATQYPNVYDYYNYTTAISPRALLLISVPLLCVFVTVCLSTCSHPFTPAKLCTAVEEAKIHAAEHALQTLGVQTEASAADASCAAAAAVASVAFPGM